MFDENWSKEDKRRMIRQVKDIKIVKHPKEHWELWENHSTLLETPKAKRKQKPNWLTQLALRDSKILRQI